MLPACGIMHHPHRVITLADRLQLVAKCALGLLQGDPFMAPSSTSFVNWNSMVSSTSASSSYCSRSWEAGSFAEALRCGRGAHASREPHARAPAAAGQVYRHEETSGVEREMASHSGGVRTEAKHSQVDGKPWPSVNSRFSVLSGRLQNYRFSLVTHGLQTKSGCTCSSTLCCFRKALW